MIDRKTAVQMAKDAGFEHSYLCQGYWLATPEQIQALITRAQNYSCEKEAQDFVVAARFEIIQKICTLGQNKSLAVEQGELLDLFNHMENEITLLRSAVVRCIAST